jgi:TIGR03009 family protein
MWYAALFAAALLGGNPSASTLPSLIDDSSLSSLSDSSETTDVKKKLAAHLDAWEKAMSEVNNLRCDVSFTQEDPIFKTSQKYTGSLLYMKPNFAIFRLEGSRDGTKNDFEAYLCNGKSVFQYNGLQKTVTEWKLPTPEVAKAIEKFTPFQRWLYEFTPVTIGHKLESISGINPKDIRQRFEIKLLKEDENYIYLDMKPVSKSDKLLFQRIVVAMLGPNIKNPYQVRRIHMTLVNQETQLWDITDFKTNIPGIDEKVFQYHEVEGFRSRVVEPITPENDPETPESKPVDAESKPIAPVSNSTVSSVTQCCYPLYVECPSTRGVCRPRLFRWRLLRD